MEKGMVPENVYVHLRAGESNFSCEVDEIKFCTGVGTSPEAVVDAVEKELGKGTRVYLEQ